MIKHKLLSLPFIKESLIIIAINLMLIVLVFLLSSLIPPVVPLFYGMPQGASQLAPRSFLTIPPLIAIGFTVTNISLIHFLNDNFIRRALIIGSVTVTILSGITVIRIMALVGNF